jgi:hypothetical protein
MFSKRYLGIIPLYSVALKKENRVRKKKIKRE